MQASSQAFPHVHCHNIALNIVQSAFNFYITFLHAETEEEVLAKPYQDPVDALKTTGP